MCYDRHKQNIKILLKNINALNIFVLFNVKESYFKDKNK